MGHPVKADASAAMPATFIGDIAGLAVQFF
jgi:hypothetical protein